MAGWYARVIADSFRNNLKGPGLLPLIEGMSYGIDYWCPCNIINSRALGPLLKDRVMMVPFMVPHIARFEHAWLRIDVASSASGADAIWIAMYEMQFELNYPTKKIAELGAFTTNGVATVELDFDPLVLPQGMYAFLVTANINTGSFRGFATLPPSPTFGARITPWGNVAGFNEMGVLIGDPWTPSVWPDPFPEGINFTSYGGWAPYIPLEYTGRP